MIQLLMHFGQDAALAFSEIVHRTFGEQNLDLKKGSDRNLQHESLVIKGSRENGSRSSLLKNNSDGMSRRYILFFW